MSSRSARLQSIGSIAIALSMVFTMLSPELASAVVPTTIGQCRAIVDAHFHPINPEVFSLGLTEAMIQELKVAAQLSAANKMKQKTLEDARTPIPNTLIFNNESLKVISLLGQGSEGNVFVAERQGNLVVAKVFHRRSKMRRNLRVISALQYRGIEMPENLGTDRRNRTLLLEYVTGLTVMDVIAGELRVSTATREAVIDSYREYVRNLGATVSKYGGNIMTQNVLLNLDTKKFVLIDPH